MGKPKPVAHKGTKSWWDGSFKTTCGQKWSGDSGHRATGWLESYVKCPSCEAGTKHKH